MQRLWLWCVMVICFSASCEEEDSSPVVILVSPEERVEGAKAGDKILFAVEIFANSGLIENIRISSKDPQQGLVQLLDSGLNVSVARFDFQYVVPVLKEDSLKIELKFEAGNGRSFTSATRSVLFSGGDVLLQEESGYTMYSAGSSKPDAFRFSDSQLLFSRLEADSLIDIYDYHDAVYPLDSLTREWRSGSGMKFVRFNDFNYPLATESRVRTAYDAGVKYGVIRNVCADDILLVGNERGVLGVIKVVYAFDEAGVENDRYLFNLKKIVRK